MTGEGTSANPYIITSAEELYEMEHIGGADKYFRLDADIDFGKTHYAPEFRPIPLYCAAFDGNGHYIRNIYCSKPTGIVSMFLDKTGSIETHTTHITNLIIDTVEFVGEDMEFFGAYSESAEIGTVILKGCTISVRYTATGDITNSSSNFRGLMGDMNRHVYFDTSTLTAELTLHAPHTLLRFGGLNRSQVRVNLKCGKARSGDDVYDPLFSVAELNDSYVFGSVEITSGNTDENSYLFSCYGSISNSYQVIEYRNIGNVRIESELLSTYFYDRDVAGEITVIHKSDKNYHPEWVYGLTTAQCKDAGYLRSIGFVCEGEG